MHKTVQSVIRNLILFPLVILYWCAFSTTAASYVHEGSFVFLVTVDFIVFALATTHALYTLKCEATVLWASLIFWMSQLAYRVEMHELDMYLTLLFIAMVVYLAIAEAWEETKSKRAETTEAQK
ncbi:hypothetical protein [Shewanella colwelliana]|uniref:hypothetical protein n=1 Tax=Shewanella colwelliana TaxID=23 RepID=UPI001C7E17E6|nr:hypothetical protein [Shewanella colwelliana]